MNGIKNIAIFRKRTLVTDESDTVNGWRQSIPNRLSSTFEVFAGNEIHAKTNGNTQRLDTQWSPCTFAAFMQGLENAHSFNIR